jgi:hypothetical protein
MYAIAARQADLLAEYLCLYRVLEGADGQNGTVSAGKYYPISRRTTSEFYG